MADNLVVIEDSVVVRILGSAKLLADIPALKNAAEQLQAKQAAARAKAGCASCRSNPSYAHAKRTIASLRGKDLERLKSFLGATKIRVFYTSDSGRQVKMTLG